MKKLLVWMLCVALLLTAFPFAVLAAPSFAQEAYYVAYYTDATMQEKNIINLSLGESGVTYSSDQPSILKPVDATSGKFEVLAENFNGSSYTNKPVIVTATKGGASATTKVYTTASAYTDQKVSYVFDRQNLDLTGNTWSVLSGTKSLDLTFYAKSKTAYCYRYGGAEAPYYSLDTNTVAAVAGGKTTLRFTAPRDGEAVLPATTLGSPAGGAKVSILQNGKVIFPSSGEAEAKTSYEEIALTLKKGDKIDFVVSGSGNGTVGTQTWKPSVRYMPKRLAENPLGLQLNTLLAADYVTSEGTVSNTDTLQLAKNLGQAEITLSNAQTTDAAPLTDASDEQDVGDAVEFNMKNGSITVTFNDNYQGGRTLESLQLALLSRSGAGSQYNVECYYTTRSAKNKEILFASFYEDEVHGRSYVLYPLLQVKDTAGKVKDIYQMIFYINAENANTKLSLAELDIVLKDDGLTVSRTAIDETVRFSNLYTDNALFQRDKELTVWGYGGKKQVEVQLLKGTSVVSTAVGTVKDGTWKVTLPAVAGGFDKYTLVATDVDAAQNCAQATNILFGDVWLLAGQSNMGVAVIESENAREVVDAANDDGIRYFHQEESGARTPLENPVGGNWKVASGEQVKNFSAVGYYFAKSLYDSLDQKLPIGIMYTAWGSTSAEAWMPQSILTKNADYAKGNDFNEPLDDEQFSYYGRRCTAPYNAMVMPLSVLNVTGVIWYQGNTNGRKNPELYNNLMIDLIDHWRDLFRNDTMPFFTVQLEGCATTYHANIREQQMKTMMTVENSGMATAIDVGERNNVHPRYKKEVGERLAAQAYAKTYGFGGEYAGPLWQSVQKSGNDIVVTFTHTTGGLVLKEGSTVNHVEISSDGTNYMAATAVIDGDTLRIKDAGNASYVRYAYVEFPDPALNLYNGKDFPAYPFTAKVGETNSAEPAYTATALTLPGESATVSFADVENHWGKPYIYPLAEAGIIKGKSANVFDPDGQITRAEFLTLALKVAGITADGTTSYSDVGADTWFAATIATAKEKGLIDSNMTLDGNFYPDQNITREEMTSIIVRLYESQKGTVTDGDVTRFSDVGTFSEWASASIGKAVSLGVVTGNPDGTFNARGNATRAEAAVIFSRLRNLL